MFLQYFLTNTLVLPTCVPSSITCSLPFCQCPGGPHDMILLLLLSCTVRLAGQLSAHAHVPGNSREKSYTINVIINAVKDI